MYRFSVCNSDKLQRKCAFESLSWKRQINMPGGQTLCGALTKHIHVAASFKQKSDGEEEMEKCEDKNKCERTQSCKKVQQEIHKGHSKDDKMTTSKLKKYTQKAQFSFGKRC